MGIQSSAVKKIGGSYLFLLKGLIWEHEADDALRICVDCSPTYGNV